MKTTFLRATPYAGDVLGLPVVDVDAAVAWYEKTMGFTACQRVDSPRSAILARDSVQIGLAENGGNPDQNGCFFEVDDVEAAYAEMRGNGLTLDKPEFRVDHRGDAAYRVFFVIAPDGLCYCLGQRLPGSNSG